MFCKRNEARPVSVTQVVDGLGEEVVPIQFEPDFCCVDLPKYEPYLFDVIRRWFREYDNIVEIDTGKLPYIGKDRFYFSLENHRGSF